MRLLKPASLFFFSLKAFQYAADRTFSKKPVSPLSCAPSHERERYCIAGGRFLFARVVFAHGNRQRAMMKNRYIDCLISPSCFEREKKKKELRT